MKTKRHVGIEAVGGRDDRKRQSATRKSTNTETTAASGMRIRGHDVFVTSGMFVTRLSDAE